MKMMTMAVSSASSYVNHLLRKPQVAAATISSSFSKVISRFTHTNPLSRSPLVMQPGRLTGRISDQFYNPLTREVIVRDRESTFGVPVTARIFASSRGWLGFVDTPEQIHISAPPFDEKPSGPIRLPSVQTLNCVNYVKCGAPDDGKDCSLVVRDYSITYDGHDRIKDFSTEDVSRDFVKNILLTCDPLSETEDCKALFLFGEELALCQPGKHNKWDCISNNYDGNRMVETYQSVYCRQDKEFYHLFHEERYRDQDCWNNLVEDGILSCDWETRISWRPQRNFKKRMRIVMDEQSGDTFLVKKYSDFKNKFIRNHKVKLYVWKLDWDRLHRNPRKRLDGGQSVFLDNYAEPVYSIANLAFFIGPSNYESFALSVTDFPTLLPNSIYYIDDHKRVGVYNLKSGKSKMVNPWDHDISHEKDMPFWVAPRG